MQLQVLKHLWTYVRAKNLQDPMDEKTIICDETLRELFSVDSINNLQINKALTKHILRSGYILILSFLLPVCSGY